MNEYSNYINIAGTVKAVLFRNEENGYSVVKLENQDGKVVTAVGCLPGVAVGEQLVLTGKFVVDSSHGEQFKTEWAERRLPQGAEAIYDFLASGAIKGIGPATATLLVSEFGDRTLDVIENHPEKLYDIRGISRKKALEISKILRKQISIRRVLEFLGNYGIKPAVGLRVYRAYGDLSMQRLEENPYIIAKEAVGASFAEADALALGMGFEGDAPERIAAAALFELSYNTRNGHCFIPYPTLVAVTAELIGVTADQIEEAVEMLIDTGELQRSLVAGQDACYLSSLFLSETYVSDRIKQMSAVKYKAAGSFDKIVKKIEDEESVEYAELQIHSLKVAAENQIMVLTGGPGTGKTTTVRAIVSLFEKLGLNTQLTAPTGRAAKRISELTGYEASTIHRLLEAGYTEDGENLIFRRNENDTLDCDVVILDECSMVDITLMHALLCAMPQKCRLVLVGDADQLPSVGPGNVFSDIIRSSIVETVRLTDIFRQTEKSRIVANAHIINRGDYPELKDNRLNSDFFFLNRRTSYESVDTVIELCAERLPKKMGIPKNEIQVLSPTRRGEAGTQHLNLMLQSAINPHAEGKKEKKFGEIVFREGDRVMQIRNNYDIIWQIIPNNEVQTKTDKKIADVFSSECDDTEQDASNKNVGTGIFNGDIGEIISIDLSNELVYVLFDDKLAAYSYDMLSELEHAFAVTVHKSQGSEYRAVVLIATEGVPQLLNRKVLYTAVTRARELLIIVGSDGTVYRMIDNHKVSRRYSGLRARLTE